MRFVAGILETHFKEEWKIHYQKSDLYLSDSPLAFNLQQDIFLQNRVDDSRKIIIDAKYKMRQQDFKNESKKGISQSDLYQMVSYAYKRGCSEVILIYPNINEEVLEPDIFEIKSGFDPSIRVTIRAIEIPFWSINNFSLVDRMMIDVLKQILSF